MAAWHRSLRDRISRFINGDTKAMSASHKCEYLMLAYQRKRATLFGIFLFILVLEIAFSLIKTSDDTFEIELRPKYRGHSKRKAIFYSRLFVMSLLASFVALMRCDPVGKEEEVLARCTWSSLASIAAVLHIVVCNTRRRSSCTPFYSTTIWSRTPMRRNAEPFKSALITMLSIANPSSRRAKWPS